MPSAIVKTIFFDLDKLAWTLTAGGNALLQPLTIGQNDTIDFNVQFIKGGAAQTLTSPSFTSGIKVLNGFSDSFVVQFGAPTGTPPTYTFTATISSTELSAALLTGEQFAIEFRDSTNGIVTLPALTLNIVASYTISGTTPTSANGTLSVAAGKTVTFPQSLTFPSALGTNTFQLSTDGAGTLTWTAAGGVTDGYKGDITVSASGATWKIDNDVVGLAQLAHMATDRVVGRTTPGNGSPELLTISGTGSVAMTTNPQFTTPTLGAATASSINAATGTLTIGAQTINLAAGVGGAGGSINLAAGAGVGANSAGGSINLSGGDGAENPGGSINTSGSDNGDYNPGGSISTNGNEGGSGGSINTSAGASNPGGSINTSNGGGSITTTAGGSITTGVGSLTFTGAGATTFALGASAQTYTFPTTTATLARTDATAQTFSAAQTISTAGGKLTIADVNNTTSANQLVISTPQTTLSLGMDGSANAKISSTRTLAISAGGTYGVNITADFLTMTGTTTLTGNLTSNGALISTPQALSGTTLGAINITTLTTTLAATGVATATLTATGVANGQIKVIVMTQATGACTVTVTNASWGGMGTAVFDAVGDTLMLQYLNSKWTPISNIGVVLA